MNATEPDPAAEFAAAMSLFEAANIRADASAPPYDLSRAFGGYDVFMRDCARIGRAFEAWCCVHVDWTEGIADCWPYLLHDKFGDLALEAIGGLTALSVHDFNDSHWISIARKLELPLYPS